MTNVKSYGCVSAVVMSALSTAVFSEILATNWDDENTFAYITNYVPDFDQLRLADLPNDGICHCGPASEANLLAYIATHGFPEYEPGIGAWDQQSRYTDATQIINDITNELASFSSGTGNGCGTSAQNLYNSLKSRVCDKFSVVLRQTKFWQSTSVRISDAAEAGDQGAIMLMLYGGFNFSLLDNGTSRLNTRPFGHFVTISYMTSSGRLGVRDPNDVPMDSIQSEFSTRFWNFASRSVQDNYSGGRQNTLVLDELYRNDPSDPGATLRLFEGYISVTPRIAYSWTPFDNGIQVLNPSGPIWVNDNISEDILFGRPLADVVIGPWNTKVYSLDSEGVIRCLRRAQPDVIEFDFPKLKGPPIAFHIDPSDRIGVLVDTELINYKLNDLVNPIESLDLGMRGTQLLFLEHGPGVSSNVPQTAAVFDPVTRVLKLVDYQVGFAPTIRTIQLPGFITQSSRMIYGGSPASFVFKTDQRLDRFQIGPEGDLNPLPMQLPGDPIVDDLAFDDRGHLLIASNGVIKAFSPRENFTWLPDNEDMFAGLPVRDRLLIPQSRSNAEDIDSSLLNQQPDPLVFELPFLKDCPGDLDLDREINGADLGIMLSEWGLERSLADIDRNGIVNGADLGILLSGWGICAN